MKFIQVNKMYKVTISVFVFTIIIQVYSEKCSYGNEENIPEYYLISMCHRSKSEILSMANYKSIEQCKNLAIKRRGMAFSFSQYKKPKNVSISSYEQDLKTCLIYSCPEIENSTTIVRDIQYDYYSTFIYPIPPENATCIPKIGMFVFHLVKMNYTEAKNACRSLGADLADISTESRTTELSKYVSYYSADEGENKKFYVGMDDMQIEGEFFKSDGISIKCSSYRAWAPGHPRNQKSTQNCVTIDSNKMWYVVDCDRKYAFICEIFPGGRYGYYDDYELIDCF